MAESDKYTNASDHHLTAVGTDDRESCAEFFDTLKVGDCLTVIGANRWLTPDVSRLIDINDGDHCILEDICNENSRTIFVHMSGARFIIFSRWLRERILKYFKRME